MTDVPGFDLVVPTVGRPSLATLLASLAGSKGPLPRRIWLVDDRARADGPLVGEMPAALRDRVAVVAGGGSGPAAARNAGWRRSDAPWVAFLDDDVIVPGDWLRRLADDLAGLPDDVAASQGRIHVPLPDDRAPTDWERNVAGLENARWATADMAYRRDVLLAVGGFDERFPRAYREDADLGLRVTDAGWRVVCGNRHVVHPVRPADAHVSIRIQAGNAEDPFMRALHGRDWRRRAGVPAGRRPWHLATVGAATIGVAASLMARRRTAGAAALTWLGLTADFAWRRIAPGPRTRGEITRMLTSSAVLPFAATWYWLRGVATTPARLRRPGPRGSVPAAVLFDRDGTLVHDVPYNGDPELVKPVDGAREALDRLRRLGIPLGVVSNQSGIARGIVTPSEVEAVNRRVEELLGPFDAWGVCPHGPDDGCRCRKPRPGLVEQVAGDLGVAPHRCIVIGDIGSDVDAARAAGAAGVLVPTPRTRPEEVAGATMVARDLGEAVDLALTATGRQTLR